MGRGDTTHLGSGRHHAEGTEGVVEQTFVHIFVKVSDEQVRADVELFFVRRCLRGPKVGWSYEVRNRRREGSGDKEKMVRFRSHSKSVQGTNLVDPDGFPP